MSVAGIICFFFRPAVAQVAGCGSITTRVWCLQVLAVVVFLTLVAGFYTFIVPFLQPSTLQIAGVVGYSILVGACPQLLH